MAIKIKGQRCNDGTLQEFYDVDAIHVMSDKEGNRYSIGLDDQDNLVPVKEDPKPYPVVLVTDGLIKRYKIQDGKLMELISGSNIKPGTTYEGDTFTANEITYGTLETGSIEVVGTGFWTGRSLIRFTASGITNGRMGIVNGDLIRFFNYYASGNYYYCNGGENDTLFFNSGANLFLPDTAPKLFGVPFGNSKMHPSRKDKYTHGMYFDLYGDESNSKKRSIDGLVQHNTNEANNIRPSVAEDGLTFTFEAFNAFEIRIYDRMLTDEEIAQNAVFDRTHYSTIPVGEREHIFDGYAPFGGRFAMKSIKAIKPNTYPPVSETSAGVHVDASQHEYTLSSLTPYAEPERTESIFEGIKFVSIPEKLYTFRKYSVLAMPYPFNGDMIGTDAGKFHVMYSSSDSTICECVDGVLIPKTTGEVTITARLAGSQLTDSFTVPVEVYDDSVDELDTLYIPRNFTVGVHSLSSKNPKSCALAMFYAIKTAGESGYHKIVFPQMDYNIYPVFDYGDQVSICCYVPSHLIIDFSGSDIYIAESPMMLYSAASKYLLFSFTDGCEYSAIKNAVFHGERRNGLGGRAETDYAAAGCGIVSFNDCYMCGTDHVDFHDTVGFYYSFGTRWAYWGGIRDDNWTEGSGLANRGRIRAGELELGDYDADGNAVSSTDHIRTTCAMHIGYDAADLKRFCFGFMGVRYYVVGSRWVKVWWYDANETLLNPGGTLYFQYSKYELPEGAQYFKLSAYGSTIPSQNYGEDSCVLRLYPFKHAEFCYANYLTSTNPNAWAITITGGQNNYIGNSYLEPARRYKDGNTLIWAVDLEDNFITTFGTVFDNVLMYSIVLHGGHAHAMVSCTTWSTLAGYKSTNVTAENQCFRMLNCVAGSFYKSAKLDTVYRGNLLTTVTASAEAQGSMIETDISSTDTDNLNAY